jgi:CHAD domain-containing protein
VRDADVELERLRREIDAVAPDDDGPGDEVVAVLAAQRDKARAALVRGLRTKRYVELLDRLVDAAVDPRVLPAAARPAADVVPELAAGPWRKLAKAVARAGDHPDDQTLHAIRKRAKRARYAADVGALVVGKPAERFAKAIAGVQEVLGEHQDACVERAWLHDNVAALSPRAALLAGRLVARADDVAERGRDDWRRAWERADEGTLRTWLNR